LIEDHFETKYGYRTYDVRTLIIFYRHEIAENEKKRKDIDFDVVALEKPLEKYCLKRKQQREEYEVFIDIFFVSPISPLEKL